MKGRLFLLALALLAGCGALWLDGTAPLGRALARIGLSGPAVVLIDDKEWRAGMIYRQGRFDDAAELYRQIGTTVTYNRGTALARSGRLREAIEAYTAVLARDPGDEDARFNMALVTSVFDAPLAPSRPGDDLGGDGAAPEGSTPSDTQAPGGGSGADQDSNRDDTLIVPRQMTEQEIVRQNFDNQGVLANRQWLATLPDQPGRYLRARIKAEHERRVLLGIALPPAEDPR